MKVYFVGAGPGDPELLTLKAHRLLKKCECCIWAGSLVNPELLELLPKNAEVHDSAGMSLDEIISVIKNAWERNLSIVRLHTGDPSIFGAIAEQMIRLDALDIPYDVVPGVSSFQAAAAALNAELTMPEVSQTIILSRVAGRTPVPETQELENLAATRATLCLFLSMGDLAKTCVRLSAFYGVDCPAAVIYKASWPEQKIIRSSLKNLAQKASEQGITKTAMVVVGPSLAPSVDYVSKLYDRSFSHGYRKGKA
ncbi:MAG: precorrin-4 C(11)-methyltransferase [Desulfobacteraceae bacterium]|jgi:precorrin-4/cobalt-precorrin-4 C11-methyltransferase|nr:precorrin-4 C(11)-methyltransferase [Desulfobacteraceae bacterium]